MPEPRVRLIAVLAIVIGMSARIGEAPDTDVPSELVGLRARAEQGEFDAQVSLGFKFGFKYRRGDGVQENDADAVRWYRLATEQGDADAQNNLGGMYASGDGVRPTVPRRCGGGNWRRSRGMRWCNSTSGSCTATA